jgi:hypothetical protein
MKILNPINTIILSYQLRIALLSISISFNSGCTKFVELKAPVTSVNVNNVYTNDITAASVLTGVYSNLSSSDVFSGDPSSVFFYAGLSSDELTLVNAQNQNLLAYYSNTITANQNGQCWNSTYPIIFIANSAIEGLIKSTAISSNVKNQLLGEAKFVRAYCYFYLVNLYGDIPLILSTNYKINSNISRTEQSKVYFQIIQDLNEAKDLLSVNYLTSDLKNVTTERVRPTKWAALSLLARVYLYTKEYSLAEQESTEIINNNSLFSLSDVPLNEVYLKNSKEAIWQLQPVNGTNFTKEGYSLLLSINGPTSDKPVLSTRLINSIEANDKRKIYWIKQMTIGSINYYYSNKYKDGLEYVSQINEYSMVFRLAEQYLIRSEARAFLNKFTDSEDDLYIIRKRAELNKIEYRNQSEAVKAIIHERQIELFTEGAHRWLDLKRTNNANNLLAPIKGSNWQSSDQLYPIPQTDIDRNPSLKGMQNPGYN